MRVQREGGRRDPRVSRPRRGSRRLFLLLVGLLVLVLPATVALASANDRAEQDTAVTAAADDEQARPAASPANGNSEARPAASPANENSEADITVVFSGDCTDFDVESTKDISFVSVNYEDPPDFTYEKFDGLSGHQFSHDGDTPIKSIVVKSGTTRAVFDCPEGGGEVDPDPDEKPECSDGIDNDGDQKVDHPADPGCQTPDDDDERDGGDGGPCGEAGDRDEDGVCDDVDECPDAKGPAENNGCPDDGGPCGEAGDRDEDGVCDDVDECPDAKGPAENNGCPDDGGPENLCTAKADDPGLLTEDTLGQTLWDGGLALSPLTEDPERNGVLSGPLGEAGTDTPIEVLTDEASCAVDLLLDEEVFPVDL